MDAIETSKQRNDRRKANKNYALQVLGRSKHQYEVITNDHYRLPYNNGYMDYYPSTGRWKSSCGTYQGKGIKPLLRIMAHIKVGEQAHKIGL